MFMLSSQIWIYTKSMTYSWPDQCHMWHWKTCTCFSIFCSTLIPDYLSSQHTEKYSSTTDSSCLWCVFWHHKFKCSSSIWRTEVKCIFLLQMCELGNFSIHVTLNNLRGDGELFIICLVFSFNVNITDPPWKHGWYRCLYFHHYEKINIKCN